MEDLDVHLARPEDGLVALSFLRLGATDMLLQVRDLTREQAERSRALAEEARALHDQDAANRRMIDLGGLISGVAHELRTPVAQCRGDGGRGPSASPGLGLFIGRRTVEAHGGTLTLEDTPGGGATFVVTLPEASA